MQCTCCLQKQTSGHFRCSDGCFFFFFLLKLSCVSVRPAGLFMDWRWLAICCSIPPTLLMVSMCFMPETPRYLLSKGKRREAENVLHYLRGPDAPVEWECARIEDAFDEQVSESVIVGYLSIVLRRTFLQLRQSEGVSLPARLKVGSVSSQGSSFHLSDLKDPGIYKPLIIGVMLMVFQQMTGINAIMFYAENIFRQAHFEVTQTSSFSLPVSNACVGTVQDGCHG